MNSKVTQTQVVKTTTRFELELTKEDILKLLLIPSTQASFGIKEGPFPKNIKVKIEGDSDGSCNGDEYGLSEGSIYITWEE